MCIKQREPAKNVLKKWKSIIDFFVSPNVVLHDGNGRVGRLIMFKECLKNNICPFIIDDTMKDYYRRGLNEYNDKKGYLLETCCASQDEYKKLLDYFEYI